MKMRIEPAMNNISVNLVYSAVFSIARIVAHYHWSIAKMPLRLLWLLLLLLHDSLMLMSATNTAVLVTRTRAPEACS